MVGKRALGRVFKAGVEHIVVKAVDECMFGGQGLGFSVLLYGSCGASDDELEWGVSFSARSVRR